MRVQNPVATIRLQNRGNIVVELLPEAAPNAVNSFISIAEKGYYDNYAVQRVVPGWCIDVSYTGFGRKECRYLIESDAKNSARYLDMVPGVIGLGGYGENMVCGSEFFFPLAPMPSIVGIYPAFGKITEGLDLVMAIEKEELRPVAVPEGLEGIEINEPVTPVIIEKVTVETFGITYPEPRKLDIMPETGGWKL